MRRLQIDKPFGFMDWDRRDQALLAFAHSPEYTALEERTAVLGYARPLLEFAASQWLDPDDIDGRVLLELMHELSRIQPCQRTHIPLIMDELCAFWTFAERELGYPHAHSCLVVLHTEAARVLGALTTDIAREAHHLRG
jgi:hypothetical protein